MKYSGKSSRINRKIKRKGSGVLNTIIDKLPVELHLPGYSYCGPGTKLKKRLERGDKGVNFLDEACKEHDIAYSGSSDLSKRHVADERLYHKAVDRVKSKDANLGEKLAASFVAAVMKGKTKLGMGVKNKYHNPTRKGGSKTKRNRRRRRQRVGGAISFLKAMKTARQALKRIARRKGILESAKIAYNSLTKFGKPSIKSPRARIIGIPKRGGFLPLIPIFAALSAIGSLGGGTAAIVKSVNAAKAAREQLMEAKRHNVAMESKASPSGSGLYMKPYTQGCGIAIGNGLYVKPYKSGCGLQLSNSTRNTVSKN